MPTCSVEDCGGASRLKRGMCSKHYQRWVKYGTTTLPVRPPVACGGPMCDRNAGDSGLCRSHYQQQRLGKELAPLVVATKDLGRPSVCVVPDCDRSHKARGYCKAHDEHLRKWGEIREVQPRNPGQPCKASDCTSVAIAKGLCGAHLHRQYLPARYGITIDDYGRLLAAQGGGCAICGGTNPNGYALSVDHDHNCCPGNRSCGKCVRGVLCSRCNFGIGQMGDDPERLVRAAQYLRGALQPGADTHGQQ